MGMLLLTRRVMQYIMIGDEIKIAVLGLHGNQVRLGIEAPLDITIYREEIYNRIKQQAAQAKDPIKASIDHLVKANYSGYEAGEIIINGL